jgi:hypothetical protein
MKTLAAALALLPSLTLADGAVEVTLPDLSMFPAESLAPLLTQTVNAIVIGQNCQGFLLSDGEWSLLNGAADIMASRLKLSTDRYESEYWDPAFALLDNPVNCDGYGPVVPVMVETMTNLGGTTGPDPVKK